MILFESSILLQEVCGEEIKKPLEEPGWPRKVVRPGVPIVTDVSGY